jgi:predicted 3-demethylubiquinone-9 3-methyltransferase (glyoxalase superfamily)
MQKIVTNLWFDTQAEEAAKFYTGIFKNSKIGLITRYPDNVAARLGREKGSVMTVQFELDGQTFIGINGGPQFPFTDAISLLVNCKDQAEIDYFWEKLTAGGGKPVQCGWLKDKFGLSWQVGPENMEELVSPKDPAKTARVMEAMMKMVKLDIAALKNA